MSNNTRWNKRIVNAIMRISTSITSNTKFNWKAPLTNDEETRRTAAISLASFVVLNRKDENITLVGHSHGGNVAIQAAKYIYVLTGKKVNIITIATPAYNKTGDEENPETQKAYINDHIQIWNKIDGVSGGLAGDDYYTNSSITTNCEIDVSSQYSSEVGTGSGKHKVYDSLGAHSFDSEHPELIDKAINDGKLRDLKAIEE